MPYKVYFFQINNKNMGWKASMLIVQNTSEVKTAEEVIQNIDDKIKHDGDVYGLFSVTTPPPEINLFDGPVIAAIVIGILSTLLRKTHKYPKHSEGVTYCT